MLTNREVASLVVLLLLIGLALAHPPTRRAVPGLVRAAIHPRLLGLWISYFLYSAAVVATMARVGLWDASILKDTLITVIVVGLPILASFTDVCDGRSLVLESAKRTLGFAAVVGAYVNLGTFSVLVEVVVQIIAIPLVMLQATAQRMPNGRVAHLLASSLLVALGAAYLWRTTTYLVGEWRTEDWEEIGRSFAMSVWLPGLLIPFVYLVAFVAATELLLKMLKFSNRRVAPPVRVRLACLIGLRFSLRYATALKGEWRGRVARATGFREARAVMAAYRDEQRVRKAAGADE